MEYIYTTTKTFIASVLSSIIVYFDPVVGKLESLFALFTLNFIVGYLAGKIINGEQFDLRKFRECFVWAAVILVIICALYFIGERNGDPEGTIQVLHIAILVAIWAFGTNILRNLCILSRGNDPVYKFFFACYYWLSFDFIKRIPFISGVAYKDAQKVIEDDLGEEFVEPEKGDDYEHTTDQSSEYS